MYRTVRDIFGTSAEVSVGSARDALWAAVQAERVQYPRSDRLRTGHVAVAVTGRHRRQWSVTGRHSRRRTRGRAPRTRGR